MSEAAPKVVKLNDLADIVASVPYMLGFEPAESLVVVTLKPPRERLSFSMRIDLLEEDYDETVAQQLAPRIKHSDPQSVMFFVFSAQQPIDGELPRQALIEHLMRASPVPVRDAALVGSDRIWSYVCADERCCPRTGRPRHSDSPGRVALAAAHALHGDVVLPNREAVVDSIASVNGPAALLMESALDRAMLGFAAVGPRTFGRTARQMTTRLVERYADPRAELTDDEAATMIVALHHLEFRDWFLGQCSDDEQRKVLRPLVTALARRALPPGDAPVCTVLAFTAYLDGEGVVVTSALERAFASDPDYSLADLLQSALYRQIHPEQLGDIFRESARALEAAGLMSASGLEIAQPGDIPEPRRSA